MKLKQHLIIKQYFIDYSLGKYSDDKQPTVADYLVKVLEQPEYENELEITTLEQQANGDISVVFESEKVLTEPQIYTRNIPNNSLMYLKKHIEASTYETIKDIPLEVNNELVVTTEGGVKLSLLVDRDFKGKEEGEQKQILLDIFKRQVRIDFSQPEEIGGKTFDLDKDSSWDSTLNQLSITSAVLKGILEVYDDDRRFELSDVHIGKLTLEE